MDHDVVHSPHKQEQTDVDGVLVILVHGAVVDLVVDHSQSDQDEKKTSYPVMGILEQCLEQ